MSVALTVLRYFPTLTPGSAVRGFLRELDSVLSDGSRKKSKRGVDAGASVTFDDIAGSRYATRVDRSKAASQFYSLLVLRGLGGVNVEQDEAYGDISISRGPQCAKLLEEYAGEA